MSGKILERLERYLVDRTVAPSRFGRQICGDPRLVFDLRRGRVPGAALTERIERAIRKSPEVGGLALQNREKADERYAKKPSRPVRTAGPHKSCQQ